MSQSLAYWFAYMALLVALYAVVGAQTIGRAVLVGFIILAFQYLAVWRAR